MQFTHNMNTRTKVIWQKAASQNPGLYSSGEQQQFTTVCFGSGFDPKSLIFGE